jgi:hypothetical protein
VAAFTYNNVAAETYVTVMWNGKATGGNTAGLAAGSLVPAGTYHITFTAALDMFSRNL